MEFKSSKLVKSIVFRCLQSKETVVCLKYSMRFVLLKVKENKKMSKSVKSSKYMDDFFSRIMTSLYLKVYLITKYKAIYCCKIQAVIRRCSAKKVLLNILQKFTRKPLCQSLFFRKNCSIKTDSGKGVSLYILQNF